MSPQAGFSQGLARARIVLKSECVRRLLLISVSVVFTLFLFELPALIEVLDYRTLIGPQHAWWAPDITDPELFYIHRPHAHQSGAAQGGGITSGYQIPPSDMTLFQWDVKYDPNGFRNAVDLKSADMVVVGDSFVEGLTVPDAQLMTSLLAHLQGKVVGNLGQSAYGPQQELVVLKRYGLPLRPRTVVWLFSESSDLGDVMSYRHAMRNPPSFWSAFVARSFTRSTLKEVERLYSPPVKAPGVRRSGVIQTSNGKKRTIYFVYPSKPFTKDDISALDETALTLAAAQKLCAAQGARLIVVFVPTKFRVFRGFSQFPEESECRNWVLNDMPERLQTAVESISSDIGYLDLTPNLVDAVKRGELPYYPDDDHWSPEGHKIAAEAINDYLLSPRRRSLAD